MASEENIQIIEQAGNREALALWHKVLMKSVRDHSFDLSARQMAIILTIYTEAGPHTVRGLSAHLNISKPAICRALDALSKMELVERKRDMDDMRNVFIQSTHKGYKFLMSFSETIMSFLGEI